MEGYIQIHKYIRSNTTIAGYDIKIAAFMMFCFFGGLMIFDSLIVFAIVAFLGFSVGSKLQELLDSKLKGVLSHWKYYLGFMDKVLGKHVPQSNIKEYVG
jgi:hypothetical protein